MDGIEENLARLKETMYEIITTDNNPSQGSGEVKATQNMGLALSNSVKKDGVNIIQVQQVDNRQIINKTIEALRVIDDLQKAFSEQDMTYIEAEVVPLIEEKPEVDLIEYSNSIDVAWEHSMSLGDFISQMKKAYIVKAIDSTGSTKEAADKLKISRTYISRLKREMDLM